MKEKPKSIGSEPNYRLQLLEFQRRWGFLSNPYLYIGLTLACGAVVVIFFTVFWGL